MWLGDIEERDALSALNLAARGEIALAGEGSEEEEVSIVREGVNEREGVDELVLIDGKDTFRTCAGGIDVACVEFGITLGLEDETD